jgi:NCS2 family nucleobase:cation symporter-2
VKKPVNIIYGVDDTPPPLVTLLSGVQLVGLISVYLLIPLAVCREAGLAPSIVQNILSLSMLGLALGTTLQAFRRGPVGSGFLAPTIFTSAFLPASLLAARMGGMALVSGMTVFEKW